MVKVNVNVVVIKVLIKLIAFIGQL